MNLKRIFPECDADTLLVQLVLKSGHPNHCKNIHKVAKALEDFPNDRQFVIGVIDDDKAKNVPTFIKKFIVLEDKIKDQNLAILNLPGTQKYIIRLHPAFEKWIWTTAESCRVNHKQYGFDTFEKLKSAAKDIDVYDNKDFKKFVNAVIKEDPPAVQTLRNWLNKAT